MQNNRKLNKKDRSKRIGKETMHKKAYQAVEDSDNDCLEAIALLEKVKKGIRSSSFFSKEHQLKMCDEAIEAIRR